MALNTRVRYKPDMFRNTSEALVAGEAPDGTAGTCYLTVQAIIYDTVDIPTINTAVPGDPVTERFINILYEATLQFDIPALAGMTAGNRQTFLQTALDTWGTTNAGIIAAMEKIVRVARRMNARPIV